MAGVIAQILASALIRIGLTAADIATAPPYFDFVGDGSGTGKPNTCIMKFDGYQNYTCALSVNCAGTITSQANFDCPTSSQYVVSDPSIGNFYISIGDDPTNESPFAGQPGLYLETLENDGGSGEFNIGQCTLGKGDQEGQFSGTACNSDDEIDLKLCFSEEYDNFSSYSYWIAIPTVGNTYACDTGS